MNVNYDDERFQQVTREQNQALENLNNTYNNMINQSDQYYQRQIDATKAYEQQQKEIQQANTDFTIQQIEQQKEQAQKDYTKEQKASYADYQKESNRYGVHQEQLAAAGLRGGGYSEDSLRAMYSDYQNRVGIAKESYDKAILNYNNSITEAQLTNNAKLAEIAYNALQTQLELSLSGFQYKNQLLANQINAQQSLNDTYYNRWQDVLKQINTENALAEEQRQFNEQMALQQAKTYSSVGAGGSGGNNNNNKIFAINQDNEGNITPTSEAIKKANMTKLNEYTDVDGLGRVQLYKGKDGKIYYYDGKNWIKTKIPESKIISTAKNVANKVSSVVSNIISNSGIGHSGGGRRG